MENSNRWEAFLGRPPITADREAIRNSVKGKRVLVTGAGGSIGSALVLECANLPIRELLLLDVSEQGIFELQRRLENSQRVPCSSYIGDICDEALLDEIFSVHKPEIVFHAAACKHVPLMERNPFTAARTNSIGTHCVTDAAARHHVEQLVLLSTDKAADPSSIMGATKRIAELLILTNASHTRMKAVRLGNVLGSSGSVAPLFEEQIASGGPVTVTHPDATRYFITVEEAVWLLLASICEPKGSSVYLPALESPHRIRVLADFLIAESHHAEKVGISYTQLRPGEKLHESLIAADEYVSGDETSPLLQVRQNNALEDVGYVLDQVRQAVHDRNLDLLIRTIHRVVPGYRPSADLLRTPSVPLVEKA